MSTLITLYQIEYAYAVGAFIFSFLTFYGGVFFVLLLKKEKYFQSKRIMTFSSFLLGSSFYVINLMVNLSVSPATNPKDYVIHGMIIILLSAMSSYVITRIVLQQKWQNGFHLKGGLMVCSGIISAFGAGNLVYFRESISLNPVRFILSVIIILTFSLCIVRFLHLIKIDENLPNRRGWKLAGSLAAGTAFWCLPYILFYGMIDQTLYINPNEQTDPYLVALAFIMLFIGVLIYIPDRYGVINQVEQSEQLVKNKQEFYSLFHHNPDAVFSLNPDGEFVSVNYIASEYTGYAISELKRMTFDQIVASDHVELAREMFRRSLQGEVHQFDVSIQTKEESHKELYVSTVPILVSGEIVGVYGIAKDVTENNRAEKMIHYLAYHDELTGMKNRRCFNEELARLLKYDNPDPFAVMLLDFDRFKRINDLFGHEFGDRVIQSIGKRLSELLDDQYVVARLGGDEFTVIVTGCGDANEVAIIAGHILESFQKPILVDNQECILTASIGIALYPNHGSEVAELVKHADMAMYDVKDKSTNNYAFYTDEMSNQTLHKIILENDLRRAIDENELLVHYQPKMNTISGKVIGFEALVRWQHPNIGLIPPDEFIIAAEETGLIIPIEQWVMRQACQQLKHWHSLYGKHLTVAVNLSQRHFYQEDIVCTIDTILKDVGLEPKFLELEITESMAMFNEKETIGKLNNLRALGIEISMDDFGTGYSSLSYMNKLPINRLKIDRLFIRDITSNAGDLAIVTTIIAMAHNLGLEIIAEGVETEEQLRILRELKCYEVQGYLYSRPLPITEMEHFMRPYDM